MRTQSSVPLLHEKKANYEVQAVRAHMQRLYDRKISPEVIETFGIQSYKGGWSYPTPANGLRWKNCDSNAQPKYSWLDKTGKATGLYYANDIVGSINAAEGVCWLVSGEPDVWAMRSAGIPHTISSFSETNPPDELIARLREWGVEVLYIAPDKDQTGERWAKKLATLTYDTGITLVCRQLPEDLGEGGDIGKLWQGYDQRQPFERHRSDLPKLEVKPEFAVRKKIQPRQFSWDYGDVPIEYRQAVARALHVTKYDAEGWSDPIHCPMPGHKNNDAHPSAGLHEKKGLHCLAGHDWVKWKVLGQLLGLGRWKSSTVTPTYHNPNCLSTEVRQAMIKSGCTSLCRALDSLYSNGWQPGQPFDCKALQRCGLSNHTARKALKQAEGNGRDARLLNRGRSSKGQTKELPSLSSEYFPLFILKHKDGLILNKKIGHRPAKTLRLPSPQELAGVFIVQNAHMDEQPRNNAGPANYKADVHAAQIRREPGNYARAQLCAPLGISATTSRSYDKRALINVKPNMQKKSLTLDELERLPETPELKGTWLEVADGSRFSATKAGATRAYRYAGVGGKVWKVRQLANTYTDGRIPDETEEAGQ